MCNIIFRIKTHSLEYFKDDYAHGSHFLLLCFGYILTDITYKKGLLIAQRKPPMT